RDLPVERRESGRGLGGPLLQLVHLHRHVVELLALHFGQDDVRVAGDAHRPGLDALAVDDQRDVVAAGQHVGAGCSAATAATAEAATTAASAAEAERIGLLIAPLTASATATTATTGALRAGDGHRR